MMGIKNETEASPESFIYLEQTLEGALGFRLTPAGLHTTPALDLESLECPSHRGLRSVV